MARYSKSNKRERWTFLNDKGENTYHVNIEAPNQGASRHIKQLLTEVQGETDKNTIAVKPQLSNASHRGPFGSRTTCSWGKNISAVGQNFGSQPASLSCWYVYDRVIGERFYFSLSSWGTFYFFSCRITLARTFSVGSSGSGESCHLCSDPRKSSSRVRCRL